MGAGNSGDQFPDANQNPAAVLAGLQKCTTAFLGNTQNSLTHGHFWSVGSMGTTLFNTIVPPNNPQSSWGACRQDCSAGCDAASCNYSNLQSNHSGGVNILMGDGSVKFIKNSVSLRHLLGHRHQGRRRGGRLRRLLTPGPAGRDRSESVRSFDSNGSRRGPTRPRPRPFVLIRPSPFSDARKIIHDDQCKRTLIGFRVLDPVARPDGLRRRLRRLDRRRATDRRDVRSRTRSSRPRTPRTRWTPPPRPRGPQEVSRTAGSNRSDQGRDA